MTQLYIDSSVAVSILFHEEGYSRNLQWIEKAEATTSADLLKAEIYAAATREGMPLEETEKLLGHLTIIAPPRSLEKEYHKIFSAGYCRGSDAYHLATLLYLDPDLTRLELLTADRQQEEIARKIGVKVFQGSG